MDKQQLSLLLREVRKFEKQNIDKQNNEAQNNSGAVTEDNTNARTRIKLAVLGTCAIQYFVKFLKYYLYENGINATIYEGEYNGINMDVFDDDSEFYRFQPDYVILLPYYTDIKNFPALLASNEEIGQCLDSVTAYYSEAWKRISTIHNVKILQSNFVIPSIHVLGNLENKEAYSRNNFIRKANEKLLSESPSNVTIVDLDALSDNIGKYNWFDYPAYFLNKAMVRLDFMPELVQCFVRQIKALMGNTKKCLVLDLDNTLWGGVVGDDGYDGIQLDPNNAVGEAYRFFQEYCLELKNRGVILAICSKNDEAVAKEPFEKNADMILHLDDIACFVANWENKADNMHKIAAELNIGIDSLVFFDDNPAERKIVKQFVPEVYVVDVPSDPALYVLQLEKDQPFEWLQLTKEDLDRTDSYIGNQKRKVMLESFVDYDEYLKALEMKGRVERGEGADVSRFTQLINKSNQFNLRTIRYSEADIESMALDENVKCLCGKLSDRYNNYGIITCVILKKVDDACFIDTWVMSCRVLKRGVESMMFNAIIDAVKEMGCSEVKAEYIRTKKNSMVSTFYETLGFENIETLDDGEVFKKEYVLHDLSNKQKHYIGKL